MIAHARGSLLLKDCMRHRRAGGIKSTSSASSFLVSTRTSSTRLLQRNCSTRTTARILNDGGAASAAATTSTSFQRVLSKLLAWYSSKLDTHPLITKGISSGIIAGTADALCQRLFLPNNDSSNDRDKQQQKNNSNDINNTATSDDDIVVVAVWDQARTARFGFLGACLVAPCIHFWYRALAARIPGTNMAAVVQRVFIDQFLYTPVFLPVWLTSLWTLEGHECMNSFTSVAGRIQETMPTVMVANWTLWIPAQSFNFAMIPLRYQVLYSNVVSLLWNVYLSHSQTSQTPGKVMDELEEVVPT